MDLNPALYLSPEMVAELALGVDPPVDVAAKYGFELKDFLQLQAQPWFAEAVYRERERQQKEGITFQSKAKMMAEEMWVDLYKEAKSNLLKPELKVDVAKQLTEVAGMKPKNPVTQTGPAGPAFTVNITIPSEMRPPHRETLTAVEPTPVIDVAFTTIEPIAGVQPDMPMDMALAMPMVDSTRD